MEKFKVTLSVQVEVWAIDAHDALKLAPNVIIQETADLHLEDHSVGVDSVKPTALWSIEE